MAFFGPGVTLIPPHKQGKWRQKWWWKEKLPGIVTVVVLVVLAVLAGVVGWMSVGDDDSGGAPPSDTRSSRTATAAPSGPARPTEKPPELPEVASEPSIAGIEATIRFEIEALNYSQRTGDFEPLKSIYNMVDCKTCKLQVERLSTNLRDGATYVDREYVITSLTAGVIAGEGGQAAGEATAFVQQPKEARLLDKDGVELGRVPAVPEVKASYDLRYSSDGWTIQERFPGSRS